MAKSTVPNPTVDSKRCCACGEVKAADAFHRSRHHSGGLVAKCKECLKEYKATKWANREACTERGKQAQREKEARFRQEDPEGHAIWQREKSRRYKEKHGKAQYKRNRAKIEASPELKARYYGLSSDWAKRNPEKVREYVKKWRETKKNDLGFRLSNAMSCGMWNTLRGSKNYRSWEDLIGYTTEDLQAHLLKTMPKGYTWADYLNGRLHIDHIIPKSVFNFKTPDDIDFFRCWCLKNLRLLPAAENIRKHNRLDKPFQPSFSGL